MKFTLGHNFPQHTPGECSDTITVTRATEECALRDAKVLAAKRLYDDFTPEYGYQVFDALATWLASDSDTFEISFGIEGYSQYTFYIEPCDH